MNSYIYPPPVERADEKLDWHIQVHVNSHKCYAYGGNPDQGQDVRPYLIEDAPKCQPEVSPEVRPFLLENNLSTMDNLAGH